MISNHSDQQLTKMLNSIEKFQELISPSPISLQLISSDGFILKDLKTPPDFCKCICQKNNIELCNDYRCRLNQGTSLRFDCQFGLHNFIIPLDMGDGTLLYIIGGRVYNTDNIYQRHMIDAVSLSKEKNISLETVAKAISKMTSLDKEQFDIYEQLAQYVVKNITGNLDNANVNTDSSAVIAKLSQEKELLKQKIINLEAKNINPHFLFNTLNTIARVAYFEKSHKTEELIYCLSDLLRYNLKQDTDLHSINEEIENIKKYLYIQKVRFKDRLEYNIDIPEEIKKYHIPNMIIQPIVENALAHGITPKRNGGTIQITAEAYNNDLTIYVIDDGYGFPLEILELLSNASPANIESKLIGMGLRNTDTRIKHLFGSIYGIRVVKSDYSGSTVSLTIPIKTT